MLFLIVLYGILVCSVFADMPLSAPSFAATSAASFPSVPACALIHAILHVFVLQLRFSRASAASRAMEDLKSMLFSACRAA